MCYAWFSFGRGEWYDEFWTLFLTQSDVSLSKTLIERWIWDPHPPLFAFLVRVIEPLLGSDIQVRRALNLVPFFAAALALLQLGRWRPASAAILILLGWLVLLSPATLKAGIDHRSYMLQLAATTAMIGALCAVASDRADYGRQDRPLLALFATAALFGLNTHYIGAFLTGAASFAVLVWLWFRGQRRWAVRLMALLFVCGLPLVAFFLVQRAFVSGLAESFWLNTTAKEAVKVAVLLVAGVALANLGATLAAAWGGWRLVQGDRRWEHQLGLVLLIAAAGIILLLLAVHVTVRSVVYARYLIALTPVIAGGIAVMAAPQVSRWRHGWTALLVIGLAALLFSAATQPRQLNWHATARIVAREVAACPSAIVHARPSWVFANKSNSEMMPNEVQVARSGYERVANTYGFRLAPAGSNAMAARCPTIVWAEHLREVPQDAHEFVRRAGFPAERVASIRFSTGETGKVAVIRPR